MKYIIHCGDIHIRNFQRSDEYQEQLLKFINKCKEIVEELGSDNVVIAVCGDIVHQKTNISNECNILTAWFLTELDKITKTIVIAGNHDMTQNTNRLDSLTPIFSMCKFKQTYYLDKDLQYQSGCVIDENIVWCVYSSFDKFNKPYNIEQLKIEYPEKIFIGLCHCDVKGSRIDTGFSSECGIPSSHFDGVDLCLLGHIHKRQFLDYNGVKIAYSGSLIQQDHGENISSHGFLLWNLEDMSYKEYDIENNDYGFYTFSIDSEDDIDNNNESVLNL